MGSSLIESNKEVELETQSLKKTQTKSDLTQRLDQESSKFSFRLLDF